MKRIVTRLLVPLCILGVAAVGAVGLVRSAETAEKSEPEVTVPLVDVVEVKASSEPALVHGTGVVEAARQVTLAAEINGRLVKISDELVVGGRIRAGAFLAQIDAHPYDLSVRERRTQVEQARAELEVEKGRGSIAKREAELLAADQPGRTRSALALREPQLRAAEVALESSKAALDRAKYDRNRTRIKAPFNATVLSETAEKGAYVGPGTAIATLVGTDAVHVRVSVPVEDLALLQVPGLQGATGSSARVIQDLGRTKLERQGTVVRLVGELDPESRTAQVLVEILDPFEPGEGGLPLLPGAFVEVEFEGKVREALPVVPAEAVSEGNRVWVVSLEGTLESRTLDVAWSTPTELHVQAGVLEGERLMTTDLPVVAAGMAVRVAEDEDRG